ncbi:putative S-layer protein [Candidatus Woesearchaeota archaeon]|nr:putative S-layer protein [Candidatus Woesearchaeota archaeon]
MYKKISFIGIILALLLLSINGALASMQEANTNPTAGNPGTTVTGSFTVQDTDSGADTDAVTGISFSMGTLTGVTDATKTILGSAVSFNPSSISSLADGTTSSAIVNSVAIPASQTAQTYQGTVTISGTEGGASVSKTFTLSVVVNSLTALDVLAYDNATALEIIGEEGETNLTGTFQIKNIGNQALSSLVFDTTALDLSDSGNHVITLTFSDPGTVNAGETKTVTATANYGESIDLDTYGGTVNVKFGSTTLDSFKLDLKVFPEICEDGIVKDGDKASRGTAFLQLNVKEPDNGDDFKPGDEIKIEVDVENDADDNLDVALEAILYNLDEDEEIVTFESDTQEIKDGNDETFEFDLEVPRDFDGDEDDRYILFLKAVEDGDEDQNCNFESKTLDFKREKDDVIVRKATLNPTIAKPGEIVELTVEVENTGSNDQRDLYIQVSSSELGINLRSNEFDLDKSGDADDDLSRRFSLNIPANAAEKDYLIDIAAVDEDDDTYDNGQSFVTLTVKSEGTTTTTGTGKSANLNIASQTKEIDAAKGSANLHILFTNNENKDLTAVVDIKTIGDWAEPVTAQTVSLHPGDNNLYFNLKLKDIEEGTYSASVTVRPAAGNDFDAKTTSLNFDVKGKQEGFGLGSLLNGNGSTTVFWVIVDVILVVVALLVIKSVLFRKK